MYVITVHQVVCVIVLLVEKKGKTRMVCVNATLQGSSKEKSVE